MITWIPVIVWALSLSMMLMSKSPVKMMMVLLMIMISSFTLIFIMSGQSWLSLVMLMILVGGILIMMMLMSSLSPNSEWGSSGDKIWITMLFASTFSVIGFTSQSSLSQMKMMVESCPNFYFLVFLMAMYFMAFSIILTKNKMPLRSQN